MSANRCLLATAMLVRVGAFTSSLRPLTGSRACAAYPRLMCSAAADAGAAQEAITASEPDKTMLIHAGSASLPPLVQVPGGFLPLPAVVKPPDADVLWQWEKTRGNMEADTSWASVWPAAANLAALIARTPELVRGLRVCELGSGLGVAGLSAAKAGATTVTLVDREALALHCAMSTAEVRGLRLGLQLGPALSLGLSLTLSLTLNLTLGLTLTRCVVCGPGRCPTGATTPKLSTLRVARWQRRRRRRRRRRKARRRSCGRR